MSSGASAGGRQDNQSASSFARLKRQLRGSPLLILLIAGAASIAVIAALLLWASAPQYRVLYSNLSEADGGSIIAELDSRSIPYRFSQGGQALMVPGNQVHKLRLQLAEQGLPKGGNVGLELMENQAFGISQFAEQINYQRGLEGELARSMESLGPVAGARIHLALAKDSVFVRRREPAKASVVLTLEPGRALGEGQVNAIAHMVSSSVPDLPTEAVTVVDQDGHLLSSPDGGSTGLDGTQLDYVAEVERTYRQRIEAILTPILGRDNVRAQVTAQLDFSRREETAERYTPNQSSNEAAVRSRQTSLNLDGDDLASGVPGALSNSPPGYAESPIATPSEDDEGATTDEAQGDEEEAGEPAPQSRGHLNRDDVINYEVDRQVSHVEHQRGQVERLSAAVVVDYQQTPADEPDAEPTATPLGDEELAQVERLVRQALGFSETRGDQVTVVNRPFADQASQEAEQLAWWQDPALQRLAFGLGRYLLVGIALLLLYLLILRPLIRRYTAQPLPAATPSAPSVDARAGDEPAEENTTDGEDAAASYEQPRRRRKTSAYEQNLKDLREMAQEDPRMVAMIARGWMNKHEQ
ncbi:flagellar basal-body MS-ring/collar protein FliF [Halomonas sabkhae]|uniref:flagellar basal-body MS-ring/collar protein FliF n=1 Tax=Halomonas sabkhae TaxID=626223 RepID=UPI0025B2A2AF|nr:flagellar basal-body MS-ring/collar protein FliF [Halomonas sabkhae]MDN3524878.1 flagellar basal-body MS-ring/collar protein FliF [Halomonas sabkhae]